MQHIVRISKDVCGAYMYFSSAVSGVIADKIREYCQTFSIDDATGLGFSFSPFGSNESDTHNIFVLKVWQADEPPPLPEVTQPYATHR